MRHVKSVLRHVSRHVLRQNMSQDVFWGVLRHSSVHVLRQYFILRNWTATSWDICWNSLSLLSWDIFFQVCIFIISNEVFYQNVMDIHCLSEIKTLSIKKNSNMLSIQVNFYFFYIVLRHVLRHVSRHISKIYINWFSKYSILQFAML